MKDYSHVQYGCGMSAPPGWRNFDASPTLRIEKVPVIGRLFTRKRVQFPKEAEYGDIVRGLPVPPGSCQGVYCSHVLEHLALSDFRVALRNTSRILKKGGTFRLVVPDLEYLARKYLNDQSPTSASTFMEESGLGCQTRNRNLAGIVASYWGNSRHLWMWDFKSIQSGAHKRGFRPNSQGISQRLCRSAVPRGGRQVEVGKLSWRRMQQDELVGGPAPWVLRPITWSSDSAGSPSHKLGPSVSPQSARCISAARAPSRPRPP